MASIKDAFEECIFENHATMKYLLVSAPIYGAIHFYKSEPQNMALVYTFGIISIIILIGMMARIWNNVMNFRDKILPSFNIFKLLFDAFATILMVAPAAVINGLIAWYLATKIYPMIAVTWIQQSAIYLTYGVCASVVITTYMLFTKKFNPFDIFDFKAISDSCIDVLIQTLWMCFQIALLDAIFAGAVTYCCWLFIGLDNFVTYLAWSYTIAVNAALIGNYLGQLNYEALHQAEEKRNKKKYTEEAAKNSTSPSSF